MARGRRVLLSLALVLILAALISFGIYVAYDSYVCTSGKETRWMKLTVYTSIRGDPYAIEIGWSESDCLTSCKNAIEYVAVNRLPFEAVIREAVEDNPDGFNITGAEAHSIMKWLIDTSPYSCLTVYRIHYITGYPANDS